MEQFLPGLLQAMEERLGRFGRPVTTVLVVLVTVALMVWCVDVIITKAVQPLMDSFDEDVVYLATVWGGTVLIGLMILLAVYGSARLFVRTYSRRVADQMLPILKEDITEWLDHVQENIDSPDIQLLLGKLKDEYFAETDEVSDNDDDDDDEPADDGQRRFTPKP